MSQPSPPPAAGGVRLHFRCAGPLDQDARERLLHDIAGGLAVAPSEAEVDPAGEGSVLYRDQDEVTLDELTDALNWLRRHERVSEVWWVAAVDT